MNSGKWYTKDWFIFSALAAMAFLITYLDRMLHFNTILIQSVHAVVATIILIFCILFQFRYPEIKQFGWNKIMWGMAAITFGTYIDILDDTPGIAFFQFTDLICGKCLVQVFLKKIIGYTSGLGLIALGFFQWIPWMINTRLNVQTLNQRLSNANREMNNLLMSLDEHIESERLNISRELHDDVAQQLIFLAIQLQICKREIQQSPQTAEEHITRIHKELSETLNNLRQISRDLRPESLYTLGLVGAIEQFIDKMRQQAPGINILFHYKPLSDTAGRARIENRFNDRELLHLFRVIQEGVRNAIKHSRAERIELTLMENDDNYKINIEDNGVGLPWEAVPADDNLVYHGHLGITGIRERVKELSGTFVLANTPPAGARLELVFTK